MADKNRTIKKRSFKPHTEIQGTLRGNQCREKRILSVLNPVVVPSLNFLELDQHMKLNEEGRPECETRVVYGTCQKV